MTFQSDCPQRRSQEFTFFRRELFKKLASATLLHLVLPFQSKRRQCPFDIGDKVADHWIDEFEIDQIEYGQVMGVCWHPRKKVWAYLVDWTHGTMPSSAYPCFDGHLVIRGDLRLVTDD